MSWLWSLVAFLPPHLKGTRNYATIHIADWYPTLANLVGVDPSDTVSVWGVIRPIDGIDVWDVLMQNKSTGPHEFLPTTEYSIIWQERWKLYTNAGLAGWFPPARGNNSTMFPASPKEWPCVAPNNPFIPEGCAICSAEKPCLFDLIFDPSERTNVATANPAIVRQLSVALSKISAYVNGTMEPSKQAEYDCIDPSTLHRPWPQQIPLHPWYGNFSGPCCRPKASNGLSK